MNNLLRDALRGEKINISREMIEHQNNDYIVNTLNDLFQELINNVQTGRINKASTLHKDSHCLNTLNKIDYAIKERFGIEIKLVSVDDSENFGVFVCSPKEVNTITDGSFNEVMDECNKTIEMYNVNEANTKAKNQVQELDMGTEIGKDNLSFIYNYRKSVNALKDKMKTSSVIIDRNKAKIIGLPSDFIAYICHDLPAFIKTLKCNAQELTAILLHEIGHAFTYIEYSYRAVTNTSVLIDTFLDNISKKNKTPKESLILAYEKVSEDKSSDYKTKNVATATVYMLDSYLKENRFNLTGSAHSGTDSEQLADQFASRFGVGVHLVSGLEKFRNYYTEQILGIKTIMLVGAVIYGGIAAICLSMGSMVGGLIFVGVIFIVCALTIDNPVEKDNDPGSVGTYDDAKRRYMRIRNDYIKRLRSNPTATKSDIEFTINALNKIDAMIVAVPDAKIGLMSTLYRAISSTSIYTVERMIEDLSENNLHLAAAKLKSKI